MSFVPVVDPETLALLLGMNGGNPSPTGASNVPGMGGAVPSPGLGGGSMPAPELPSPGLGGSVPGNTRILGGSVQDPYLAIEAIRGPAKGYYGQYNGDTYSAPAPVSGTPDGSNPGYGPTVYAPAGKDYNGGYGQTSKSSKSSGTSSSGGSADNVYTDASTASSGPAMPNLGATPNFYPTLPMSPIRRKILENLAAAGVRAQWPAMNWRPDMAPMFTSGAFGPLTDPNAEQVPPGFPAPGAAPAAAPAVDERPASTFGMGTGTQGGFPGSPPPVWPGQPNPQTGLPPMARMGGAAPTTGGGGFSRGQLSNLLNNAKRQQAKGKKKGGR